MVNSDIAESLSEWTMLEDGAEKNERKKERNAERSKEKVKKTTVLWCEKKKDVTSLKVSYTRRLLVK
ncbi:Hypothetical predicted protein [Octopus vulgaris]|uniref:Uncharacterized protein n=1 Tax=Octopus vulgaris TaxID=6645 RepID=A0AA36BXD2_OCTVU|nr:Hypothetical predicted protein [Octopus vulgaris]